MQGFWDEEPWTPLLTGMSGIAPQDYIYVRGGREGPEKTQRWRLGDPRKRLGGSGHHPTEVKLDDRWSGGFCLGLNFKDGSPH